MQILYILLDLFFLELSWFYLHDEHFFYKNLVVSMSYSKNSALEPAVTCSWSSLFSLPSIFPTMRVVHHCECIKSVHQTGPNCSFFRQLLLMYSFLLPSSKLNYLLSYQSMRLLGLGASTTSQMHLVLTFLPLVESRFFICMLQDCLSWATKLLIKYFFVLNGITVDVIRLSTYC